MTKITVAILLFISCRAFAQDGEFHQLSDYKKVLVQFMKPISLQLSQSVAEPGHGATPETKAPNFRILHESAKLLGPESDPRPSCTVYEKTMLSNRTKNYSEEAPKLEKMIADKTPIELSSELQWTISRIAPNDLGVLIWLQAGSRKIQIDCENKTSKGEEKPFLPKDVFATLSFNEIRFFKDGKEIKPGLKKEDPPAPASADTSSP